MNWKDYKNDYTLEALIEMRDVSKNLKPSLEGYLRHAGTGDKNHERYSTQLKEIEESLPEINKAIEYYDFDPESELSEQEEQIIEALKETALGREGNIFLEMFRSDSVRSVEKLILRGIVTKIDHYYTYSHLPNQTHLGLVGEEYPQTQEEWSDFRHSGYSEKVSYGEFKRLMEEGQVEWTSQKISEVLDSVQEVFNTKIDMGEEEDVFWMNFTGKVNNTHRAEELVREGRSREYILDQMFIEHVSIDEMSAFFTNTGFETKYTMHSIERGVITDLDWWNGIIERRKEFLEETISGIDA